MSNPLGDADEPTESIPIPVKRELLCAWRERYWGELDATINVLICIRDSEKSSDKNRIEAGKAISRMLGVLAAERIDASKVGGAGGAMAKPQLKGKHKTDIDAFLDEL